MREAGGLVLEVRLEALPPERLHFRLRHVLTQLRQIRLRIRAPGFPGRVRVRVKSGKCVGGILSYRGRSWSLSCGTGVRSYGCRRGSFEMGLGARARREEGVGGLWRGLRGGGGPMRRSARSGRRRRRRRTRQRIVLDSRVPRFLHFTEPQRLFLSRRLRELWVINFLRVYLLKAAHSYRIGADRICKRREIGYFRRHP